MMKVCKPSLNYGSSSSKWVGFVYHVSRETYFIMTHFKNYENNWYNSFISIGLMVSKVEQLCYQF
ncbi:hypothetical protein LAA29_10022 [Leuconostoc carnosum]|nr:hypothetical protein LCAC16_10021 [Leuconostoc carnosum]SPO32843.1 hypothetical protein LAA29_10022 [Leuconostoc carnosum]